MTRSLVIDCFPSSVERYREDHAIVSIDVIRATTMAITAAATGRRVFCAESLDVAHSLAQQLGSVLLAGELGGDMPETFDMNNSPAELLEREDIHRPMVLLSSNGTKLMLAASAGRHPSYVASLRNFTATANVLRERHPRVAILGAGSRQEFREEDAMCCAWIAELLMKDGYVAENTQTEEIVRRWSGAAAADCCISNSVAYLRRTNQLRDLDFILAHVDDLDTAYTIADDEVVSVAAQQAATAA